MKYRLIILCLHLSVFFALQYGHEQYIAPIFGYEGYVFEPNEGNWYWAIGCVMLLSLITPTSVQKPSTVFQQLMLATILIPMMVLFYAENKPWEYVAQVLFAYSLTVVLPFFLKINPPKFFIVSKDKLRRILFVISYVYIAAVLLMGGGEYLNFDFSTVYDFRNLAAKNLPGLFGYISPMVAQIAMPMGFLLSLLYRKYLMALIMLCSAVLTFGLTTHKSTLFAPFLILFIYVVSLNKNLIFRFNVVVLVTILLSISDFWLWKNYDADVFGWTGTLMMGRVFFLPAQLNYMYHDFFSKNDWVWFSDSKITLGLVDYKYPLEVAHMIGREYFNRDSAGANTGWLGSGYMQAGFFGMVLYAVIIAIVFKYIDACARHSGERGLITAAVIVPVAAVMSAADVPTAFLTHGLFVSLLLITCFRGSNSSTAQRSSRRRLSTQPLRILAKP